MVDAAGGGVGKVVRVADILDSTPRQILSLSRLLELPSPRCAHVPLVLGRDGRRLAKSTAP